MNFEFRVFKTPTPWSIYFAGNPKYCGSLWEDEKIVAVAFVNGIKFARVVLDGNFEEPVALPPGQKVRMASLEDIDDHLNKDDDEDEDELEISPRNRLASISPKKIPLDPEKKYFVQHEDELLTPFISYAATLEEAEAHCRKAAAKFLEFVVKATAAELKYRVDKSKTNSEDMVEFVKLGWSFMFNKAHKRLPWTATKQGSPQCWSGATWRSAMHRGCRELMTQARKAKFPKL
jgi:hypothetical protein